MNEIEMKVKKLADDEPCPILTAVSVALVSLTLLLRHANEGNYLGQYEASCEAAKGISALASILPNLNLD